MSTIIEIQNIFVVLNIHNLLNLIIRYVLTRNKLPVPSNILK